MANETKAFLKRRLGEMQAELRAIEDDEENAAALALVGRHFRRQNYYGCGHDSNLTWFLYRKVIAWDREERRLILWTFQTDCYGRMEEVARERHCYYPSDSLGEEISLADWDLAQMKFRERFVESCGT